MIPTLQVVKIQTAQILAGSEKMKVGNPYSDETVMSRGAGFSDDDDWGE